MKLHLTFCFLGMTLATGGHNPDSLWQVWRSATTGTEARLNALHTLIVEDYLDRNQDSALLLIDQQLTLAQSMDYPLWEIKALLSKGIAYYHQSNYEEAAGHFHNSLERSQATGEHSLLPEIYRFIGIIAEAKGDTEKSLEHFRLSYELSRRYGDSIMMARALNSLAIASQYYLGDYDRAIEYYREAIALNEQLNRHIGLANNYYNLGDTYYSRGDHITALKHFFAALTVFEKLRDTVGIQDCYNSIGNIYDEQDDHSSALAYYEKSLALSRLTGDQLGEALVKINIADLYMESERYQEAIVPLEESVDLLKKIDNKKYLSTAYYHLGQLYLKLERTGEAKTLLDRAKVLATEMKNESVMANAALLLSDFYFEQGNYSQTIAESNQALALGEKLGHKELLRNAHELLAKVYQALKDEGKELQHYRQYILYRDSLRNEATIRETTRQEMQYQFDKKHLADSLAFAYQQSLKDWQISREKTRRNAAVLGLVLVSLLSAILYRQYGLTQKAREQSDKLLLNILPAETAQELKSKGYTTAKSFDQVTILFTDFKDFTIVSEHLTPEELVNEINYLFSAFDEVIQEFGLEKIKTNGDSYIAVAGLPENNRAGAKEVVLVALEMQQIMRQVKLLRQEEGKPYFEMRIGIHSGQVVAGVVGVKKFQYDIWGDTVNTAARMETTSEAGKINISQATYELIQDEPAFTFESRGKIQAKNKGFMNMYFVESTNPEVDPYPISRN